MLRLPPFTYRAPRTAREAAELLAERPGEAMLIAGGTDVLPNMKRRQQEPTVLVGLRSVREMGGVTATDERGLSIGASTTLTDLLRCTIVQQTYPALWQAAGQIATPLIRNQATVGGNLCLDTRCSYYDQSYEWRQAIGFCMKKDGRICWVATSSPKCLAVSSSDTAPALIALDATVTLVGAAASRTIPVAQLYRNDGIAYLVKQADEIVTRIELPVTAARSAYWKLRRRGSFDFPVLAVAAAVSFRSDGAVSTARIVLGGVASSPVENRAAGQSLIGRPLDDAAIAAAAELAAVSARPMDNTDFPLVWRKRVTREFVGYALREVRGDDVRDLRRKVTRQEMIGLLG